jgi:hypothetical protein
MTTSKERYEGKPLLRLLECYVLWAIDQLPETQANTLSAMTPKLQSLYRKPGDWKEVIAAVMEFPPDAPKLIRDSWAKNSEIALMKGVALRPEQFAQMFVDQNMVS